MVLALVGLAALSGCGGGSSSPAPTITASPASVTVSASVVGSAPTAAVSVSFANAPSGVFFSASDFTTSGIAGISTPTYTATQGSFTITFHTPDTLKPATYTDTVTLLLCSDAQCKVVLKSSPLPVSYTVTAATGPSAPQVALDSTTLTYSALYMDQWAGTVTPDPSAFTFTNFPAAPVVQVSAPTTGVVSSATFVMTDATHGGLALVLQPASGLAQGTYSTVINVTVCLDQACVNPVGSPFAVTLQYVVTNRFTVAGANGYTIAAYPLMTTAFAANSQQNLIYALVGEGSNTASVQEIDATTGLSALAPLPVTSWARTLALSDDGQYLYTNGESSVEQIQASTLTVSLTIPTPTGPSAIAVEPGQSQTIAVATENVLQIYDSAVARPNSAGGGVFALTWTGTPAVLAGLFATTTNFCAFPVNASGVSEPVLPCVGPHDQYSLIFANGFGYADGGTVVNQTTMTLVTTLSAPNATITVVVPDATLGKAFATTSLMGSGGCYIESFNLTSNAPIASAWLPTLSGGGSCTYGSYRAIARWGANGLAVSTGTDLIAISGAFVGP